MTTTHFEAPARGWSLLGSLSRLGTGLISFFASASVSSGGYGGGSGGVYGGGTGGYGEQAPSASATAASSESPMTLADMACCSLAFPNGPFCQYTGHPRDYVCPPGWYRQWWYCCQGSRMAGCGECTRSQNTCWQGPFNCSIWWWEGRRC